MMIDSYLGISASVGGWLKSEKMDGDSKDVMK
jgi:hypothetical protein